MRPQRHAGFPLVLALIILIAQLGAQAHAYAHLARTPDPVQRSAHPAPCVECSAFAPLLAALSGVSYPVVAAAMEPLTLGRTFTAGFHRTELHPAYRSRAPPSSSGSC